MPKHTAIAMQIKEGDIIRFKSAKGGRDWIAIHYSKCTINDIDMRYFRRKHIKNYTGFYLYSAPWYEGDWLTNEPYGKGGYELQAGMFPDIEIVGNICNKQDFEMYKEFDRITTDKL